MKTRIRNVKNPRKAWTTTELKFLSDNRDKSIHWLCGELNRSLDSVRLRLACLTKR